MAAIRTLTFESGLVTNANGDAFDSTGGTNAASLAVTTESAIEGSDALDIPTLSSAFANLTNTEAGAALNLATPWVSLYVRVDTLPSATARLVTMRIGSVTAAEVRIHTAGAVRHYYNGAVVTTSGSGVLAASGWYRVALRYTASGGSEAQIYDSDDELIFTSSTVDATLTGNITNLRVGSDSSAVLDVLVDYLVLDDAADPGPYAPSGTIRDGEIDWSAAASLSLDAERAGAQDAEIDWTVTAALTLDASSTASALDTGMGFRRRLLALNQHLTDPTTRPASQPVIQRRAPRLSRATLLLTRRGQVDRVQHATTPAVVAEASITWAARATLTMTAAASGVKNATITWTATATLSFDALAVTTVTSPPATTMLATVSLVISTPLPEGRPLGGAHRIETRVTTVEVETQMGGYGLLRVGMRDPDDPSPRAYLTDPVEVVDRAHVTAHVGSYQIHEGVLRETEEVAGYTLGVTSLGYGLTATDWTVSEGGLDDEAEAAAILRDAFGSSEVLALGGGSDLAGLTTPHAWSEMRHRTLGEIVEQLLAEGYGTEGVPGMYLVYEGRVATIRPKLPPARARYRVPVDRRVPIRRNWADIWDAARMVWTDSRGVEQMTDWFYRAGMTAATARRRRTLTGAAGNPDAAYQFVRTWINERSRPVVSVSLTLGPDEWLETASGERCPGYLVRAGEWLEIPGYPLLPIERTRALLMERTAQITVGAPPYRSMTSVLVDGQRAADALERKRDYVTSGRLVAA